MSIGDNIRKRRRELHLSLEEIAASVGISRQTMSRYETGIISNIPLDRIEAIAKALRTSPAYLMGWENASSFDNPDAMDATVAEQLEVDKQLLKTLFAQGGSSQDDIENLVNNFLSLSEKDREAFVVASARILLSVYLGIATVVDKNGNPIIPGTGRKLTISDLRRDEVDNTETPPDGE